MLASFTRGALKARGQASGHACLLTACAGVVLILAVLASRASAIPPPDCPLGWDWTPHGCVEPGHHGDPEKPFEALFTWGLPERVPPRPGTSPDFPAESLRTDRTAAVIFDGCPSASGSNTLRITAYEWTVTDGSSAWNMGPSCRTSWGRNLTSTWTNWTVTLTVTRSDGQRRSITKAIRFRDLLITSLGDSAASGEGVPEIYKGAHNAPQWADGDGARCDRSGAAASALAARQIERNSLGTDSQTTVTFWHLACSGAFIRDYSESDLALIGPSGSCVSGITVQACVTVQRPVAPFGFLAGVRVILQSGSRRAVYTTGAILAGARRLALGVQSIGKPWPVGTSVTIDDYGQGGLLTPYYGVRPPANSCDPNIPRTKDCVAAIPPQADQLRDLISASGRRPDVVLITAGANDTQWADLLERCYPSWVHLFEPSVPAIGDACLEPRFTDPLRTRLGEIQTIYGQLARRLDEIGVERSSVYLTEYFDPTRDNFPPGLGPYTPFCPTDKKFGVISAAMPSPRVRIYGHDNIISLLNQVIGFTAGQQGWHYVDGIQGAFDTHGICARSGRWINGVFESQSREGDEKGGWHPNIFGQRAIANILLSRMTAAQTLSVRSSLTSETRAHAPRLTAPAAVARHGVLAIQARGLTPGRYRVSLQQMHGLASCAAPLGPPVSVRHTLTLNARLPARLTCRAGRTPTHVPVHPGRYELGVTRATTGSATTPAAIRLLTVT